MKMKRARTAAAPAIKNRPQKLSRSKLLEEIELVESRQMDFDGNHVFSISVILGPSVTLRIASEISGTSGDPLGKTCKPKVRHEIFQSKK